MRTGPGTSRRGSCTAVRRRGWGRWSRWRSARRSSVRRRRRRSPRRCRCSRGGRRTGTKSGEQACSDMSSGRGLRLTAVDPPGGPYAAGRAWVPVLRVRPACGFDRWVRSTRVVTNRARGVVDSDLTAAAYEQRGSDGSARGNANRRARCHRPRRRGDTRDSGAEPDRLAEVADRPVPFDRDLPERAVGVHRVRMADGSSIGRSVIESE